jgi:nucleoside-diphosphate-sugar epimerase
VDFIHYKELEKYEPIYELLIKNTEHLIFLSSYRVYADREHPITESAPKLLDVSDDAEFLGEEDYALPKARLERFLFGEHMGEPWTVVRPVISFSYRRFDLFVYSDNDIWNQVRKYGKLLLPEYARDLTAGIDWAGNSGKLIANLLFKKEAIGEAYTVSSGHNLTWGQIAEMYSGVFGFEVEWCDEERFIESYPCLNDTKKWLYVYDRRFDRAVDNSKILAATGLRKENFLSVKDGLLIEKNLRGD